MVAPDATPRPRWPHVVDPIGDGLAPSSEEIVDLHLLRLPVGCHSRPLFLKLPTNSFFLVSTDTTGSPAPRSALIRPFR